MADPVPPPKTYGTGILGSLAMYWSHYGGVRAVAKSGYTWCAVGLTIVSLRLWADGPGWIGLASDILPNLVGFTIGGLAIVVVFGDDRFRKTLARGSSPERESAAKNVFLGAVATILHFLVIQVSCLLLSVVVRGLPHAELAALAEMPNRIGTVAVPTLVFGSRLLGTWLLYYSLFLVLATGLAVMRMARWLSEQKEAPLANNTTPGPQAGSKLAAVPGAGGTTATSQNATAPKASG